MYQRKGWAPKGITPVQKAKFQRGLRLQLLAAYTQKGVKLSRFLYGSVDKPIFEDFIEQLLRHCGRWPEPETVLIMDNAAFYYSDRIQQMCDHYAPNNAGTDGQGSFFGDKLRNIVNDRFRTMTLCRNPELWQSLPAEKQHELESSPEVNPHRTGAGSSISRS